MKSDVGSFLDDRQFRSADVRDATITSYEGNGVYVCQILDTGASVRAIAAVNLGLLDVGTHCVIAPMAAGGAANAQWRIVTADTATANLPTVPPRTVGLGPTLARIAANPTILTAGGAAVDVVVEGSGLTAGPTYGDPGIFDWIAPDITSTRVLAHVKALATVAVGTVTTTGTSVVGTLTNFTHFASGQLFVIAGQLLRIDTITDDTHLTLTSGPTADVTDSAYSVGYAITAADVTVSDFFQVIATPSLPVILYGNTSADGAHDGGTIFKYVTPGDTLTVLHSFNTAVDSAWHPFGQMALVGNVLYFACIADGGSGYGAIFKFNLGTSTLTLVHAFDGATSGANPYGGLLQVSGILYGTTFGGGANSAGTIYKIDPSTDTLTVLASLDPNTTGRGGLIVTYDGAAIYTGAAEAGDGGSGGGTVLRINSDDTITLLYTYPFAYVDLYGSPNLESVNGDGAGTLYLVTQTGSNGDGNIGSIDRYVIATNTWTRLVEFTPAGAEGHNPTGPLTKVGTVWYGNANAGATSNKGSIFRFDPSGPTVTGVHDFTGADGDSPLRGGLYPVGTKLYITTYAGGANSIGALGVLDTASDTYALLHSFAVADGDSPDNCRLISAP